MDIEEIKIRINSLPTGGLTAKKIIGEFDMVVYDPVNVCYRIKVAAEWSKLNQVEILPEMINCEDCRMDGVKTPFCDSLRQIRQCAMSQKVETCISCGQLKSCE